MRRALYLLLAAALAGLLAYGAGDSETAADPGAATGARAAADARAAATPAGSSAADPPAGSSAAAGGVGAVEAARRISGAIGSRPAGGRGERRAHAFVAGVFRAAGLAVTTPGFGVPGRGRSRNVIGVYEAPQAAPGREAEEAAQAAPGRVAEEAAQDDCLAIVMAHADSVPPGLGANDNASGVGVLAGLSSRLRALDPACDVWLVATGAEERVVIGTGYHVGSAALVREVRQRGRAGDLRIALSVDMVGRGRRFYLRSPQPAARPGVEGAVLAAAKRTGVTVRWARDSGAGNSDHREFELAGLPAAVLEAWRGEDACHHERCDRPGRLQAGALRRAQRVAESLLAG